MTVPPPRRHLLHRVLVTALAALLSVPGVGLASTSLPLALAGEAEDPDQAGAEDSDQAEGEHPPADDPEDPEGADAEIEDAPGDEVEDVLDDPGPTGEEPAGPPDADAGPDAETVAALVAIVLLAFLILAHALYRDPRQHGR